MKNILKARRITYAALADRLGLSEPTIKRIFAERDCKLSRMTEICAALDLTLDDLVAEANRVDLHPFPLGDRLETQLADDWPAFHLFLLLLDDMTETAIQEQYQMPTDKFFKLGMRLEKLGLAVVMPDNRFRLTVQAPVHFRRDGPLHQRLLKLNMDFLRTVYLAQDTEHSAYLTQTRRITRKTAHHILARLRDVQVELSNLARRDQLTQPDDALSSYKIGIALAPVVFSKLLSLAED
ncbi:helix-turn-helix transcriptional regulator [Roseibium sp.]|uniref:helix-turn-helix domain-containing protein n=1 Tax=Roseibium sp. TaxID=1936156 RepID=UPI0032983F07